MKEPIEDVCKCKPNDRIVNPPKERNEGEIKKCVVCGNPLAKKFQEEQALKTK